MIDRAHVFGLLGEAPTPVAMVVRRSRVRFVDWRGLPRRRRRCDAGHVAIRRADGRTGVRATRLRFYALALALPGAYYILVYSLPGSNVGSERRPKSRLTFQYLKKYKFAEFLNVETRFTATRRRKSWSRKRSRIIEKRETEGSVERWGRKLLLIRKKTKYYTIFSRFFVYASREFH